MFRIRRQLPGRSVLFCGAALAAGVALGAQTPAPAAPAQAAPPAPLYDATFDTNGQIYSGTTTFVIAKDGTVTGKMHLDNPVGVDAMLGGTVKDSVWAIDYAFAIADQGCDGRITGTAKLPADMNQISGDITVSGSCVQDDTPATFRFTKRVEPGGGGR